MMIQPDLFDSPPVSGPFEEEQNRFFRDLQEGPTVCPCCYRPASLDVRRVHAVQARALIAHCQIQEKENRAVHFRELRKIAGELTDYPVLGWFGLIVAEPNEKDPAKKSPGLWRVTELGFDFVQGRYRVPEKIVRWNKRAIRFEGDTRAISDVLGEPFDYRTIVADRAAVSGFDFETDIAGNRRNP
jgi:hypothetical protein